MAFLPATFALAAFDERALTPSRLKPALPAKPVSRRLRLSDDGVVWPSGSLSLAERARAFVRVARETIYGAPSYVAAWSLLFGWKASPGLFAGIDANRARSDPVFFRPLHYLLSRARSPASEAAAVCGVRLCQLAGYGNA